MRVHKIICATALCGILSLAAPYAARAAGCGEGHENGSGHADAGCAGAHHEASKKASKHAEQDKRARSDRGNERNSGSSERGSSDHRASDRGDGHNSSSSDHGSSDRRASDRDDGAQHQR
jgi:hypothetical protein